MDVELTDKSRIRAAIYARISLDDKDDDGEAKRDAVGRQIKDCQAKAVEMGWIVAGVYEDNDVSASKNVPRPEYERLMADFRASKVNALVVYDLDRLTRKPAELEAFIDLTSAHNVLLANVSGDVDLTNANGRMLARFKGAIARQESERIGERVRRQKQQMAERGIPHKGRDRQFGYTEHWEPHPTEAALVEEMFRRRAGGESTNSICTDFNRRGETTVAGKPWASSNMLRLFTKTTYGGKNSFKGEVIADSAVPSLVDWDLFEAAQREVVKDRGGTNTRRYLLSGIAKCHLCLSPMKGNPAAHQYRCSRTYGGCGRLSVNIAHTDKWIGNAAIDKSIEERTKRPRTAVRDFASELAGLEADKAKLQAGYEAEVYTLKEVQPKIKAVMAQIKAVSKERIKTIPKRNVILDTYMDWFRMELGPKRAFVTTYISDVIVYPTDVRGRKFDPTRLEVHYTDGSVERLDGFIDPEDV
ncbi:MAG: Resolvase protein [Marmoricola sp.]|nr:Resolvase protein [Marmoricola sp.]